jgi:Transposase DDE domain group 1
LRPTFDRRIKLEFHGAKITSDGGLRAYRELDDALGLTDTAITKLLDGRRGKNTRHKLSGLFRQAVFGRLAGYEDSQRRGAACPGPRHAGHRRP